LASFPTSSQSAVWEYLDYFAHAYKMAASDIPDRVNEVIAQLHLGLSATG